MSVRYIGSGPYCYANSLAMVMGDGAPEPAVLEMLTGSPFGMQLHHGHTPFFDPLGWDPVIGLDAATELLGWTSERSGGGTPDEAAGRLRRAAPAAPLLVGPVELGLLLHRPGSGTAFGADHFVVVIGVEKETVLFHDPQGHPYATLPIEDFLTAWRADSIGYPTEPYTMRGDFRRVRRCGAHSALRASLVAARRRLAVQSIEESGSLGGAAAAERLAELVEEGLRPWQHEHLVRFAVRVGARRLADASVLLARIGEREAARIAEHQARLVGALQHPLVNGDRAVAAGTLRTLAPTYERMARALGDHA
ncbi:hypothetical protein GCM10023085_81350 [Actinomadura viridis]|uniref:Uncharacterized protein n=1 Tax=Actinomadura viridis TaxID=58110 RepID=A0A931GQ51_9ACTN|nr:hypothetical protein [Actinomadura viridis]MBG6088114.1 hypothetical protein [Actinomadura viridis]